ncbi:hypothetical protein QBC42DRAFT_279933 [Cladorrhinum samala]|uniref:Secreted protein n=1 Tax=Cladorrhinum samala TaxID=585594 RepID=A0AAV9HDA8_9PEZI|nr:hypothetical protein QBC42DRAFT_279933 [Cladorrhinum samala]
MVRNLPHPSGRLHVLLWAFSLFYCVDGPASERVGAFWPSRLLGGLCCRPIALIAKALQELPSPAFKYAAIKRLMSLLSALVDRIVGELEWPRSASWQRQRN